MELFPLPAYLSRIRWASGGETDGIHSSIRYPMALYPRWRLSHIRSSAGWPVSTKSMIRTSVLLTCSRCSRPTYYCKVPFHDTGIASTRVSNGGWSNPSPTNLPVASSTRGASEGKASSCPISAARCFRDIRPCRTNSAGIFPAKAAEMASRWSVRSVNTSTLRPWPKARPISVAIAAVRP